MKRKNWITAIKGAVIGATMLVPGFSGGTMAMILGIYDELIESISTFTKKIKENFLFLCIFCAGSGLGILIFAKPLSILMENFTNPMTYFFIGAVIGGIPLMLKKSEVKKLDVASVLSLLIGIAIVIGINYLPENLFVFGSQMGIKEVVLLLVAGIFAAIALVLPGISVSFLLLVLGLHRTTIEAIANFDFIYLFTLGIGVLLGVILTTRLLDIAMKKYPKVTYMMILGFIIGSVAWVFPGLPMGIEWIVCPALLAAGCFLVYNISKIEA